MDEVPPEPEPWNLPVKWVVLTAVILWLLGASALLVYLFGPKELP